MFSLFTYNAFFQQKQAKKQLHARIYLPLLREVKEEKKREKETHYETKNFVYCCGGKTAAVVESAKRRYSCEKFT